MPPISPISSTTIAKIKSEKSLAEEVALYGVSRTFAYYVAGGNGNTCMCNLCVFINIELGGGNLFLIEEAGNTVLPGFETVESRECCAVSWQG